MHQLLAEKMEAEEEANLAVANVQAQPEELHRRHKDELWLVHSAGKRRVE